MTLTTVTVKVRLPTEYRCSNWNLETRNGNQSSVYITSHGRQVQFTDRMWSYVQELHQGETSHNNNVLANIECELHHVQEEINRIELQIAKRAKEFKMKT